MEAKITAPATLSGYADYYKDSLPHFSQQHRSGGSFNLNMFQVDQPPVEMIDPPVDEFSIVCIVSKDAKAEIDVGDGWSTTKGAGIGFVGAHPEHQTCGFRLHKPVSLLVASAPATMVRAQLEHIGIYSDPFSRVYSDFDFDPASMQLMTAIWTALENGGLANNLMIDGYYIAILGRLLQNQTDKHAFALVPDLAKPQLMRVIDYIEAHFDVPLLTSELAAIAAMSTAQFGRSFKAATGYSPHAYVTIRRIEHAKRMLRQQSLNITQIAFCCGFSSAAHFATTFQQQLGQSPSAYRSAAN